jgi:NADH:ubiquinone oxidoreductase subunit 6 (subunit J)
MPFEPNHLSVLGIIHTAISILALIAGVVALLRYGKINMTTSPGRAYIWLTILTCITAFPIMKLGHPTAGHYLGIIILVLIAIGLYAKNIPVLKKGADYIQIIAISTTLFLSMIPTTVETLTRVPISKPIASGPADPLITKFLLVFVILYIVGVTYQLLKLRKSKKGVGTPTVTLT